MKASLMMGETVANPVGADGVLARSRGDLSASHAPSD